ncbi:MAG: hypothetical protein KGI38_11830 [Thaumarchaeota archaeon]|nr:hypothetical protein [Nitrososphaerota archaeon]
MSKKQYEQAVGLLGALVGLLEILGVLLLSPIPQSTVSMVSPAISTDTLFGAVLLVGGFLLYRSAGKH